MSQRFDIDKLRRDISKGTRALRITTHAQVEAFKDGLLLSDLRYVFDKGEVIELYPDQNRGLLCATIETISLPAHIVVEDTPNAGVIITAYIPDRRKWSGHRHRRNK